MRNIKNRDELKAEIVMRVKMLDRQIDAEKLSGDRAAAKHTAAIKSGMEEVLLMIHDWECYDSDKFVAGELGLYD